MIDERSGKVFTNATHQDVEHCELSIPENSPKWVQELLVGDVHKNSEKLWNAVEQFEKRVDAQDNFTSRGMIADWCIHNHFDEIEEIEKPHVHVMLTMREAVEKDATILQKLKSYIGLERASSEMKWADYANAHLAKAGLDIRIDHRSYKEQGIELIPQPKLGQIEASEQLVTLSANEQGEALKLTTKDMIRVEKQIVEMALIKFMLLSIWSLTDNSKSLLGMLVLVRQRV
eukprot:gene18044-18281_t